MKLETTAIVGLLCSLLGVPGAEAQNRGDCQGRQPQTWSITVAAPDEPGQRMVVEGRVLAADGERAIAGATVFVFHTDAEGYYSPGGMDESNARLCGLMLTDAEGRYRFETIKPARYATGDGPRPHVHYRVWGPDLPRQSLTLFFQTRPGTGDRDVDAAPKATWATSRPVEVGADGVLRVTRDLRLR